MKITYYGQSCFMVELAEAKLLFDPFIKDNPLAKDIDINTLQPDYILLTHGHQDHVADAAEIAKHSGAKIISNYEIVTWYGKQGIEGHPMNHGGKWKFDFGTVKYVNAIHSSGLPDGTYGGNPGGFVVWNEDVCFYHAGDTALTYDMQLIPMSCPAIDFAILPLGDNFTMGYEEAATAANFVDCDTVIGCHYDTFGFIEINHDDAKKHFNNSDIALHLLDVGESMDI